MKYIKLGEPYIKNRKIEVKILEQSHRNCDFGVETTGPQFKASNNLKLVSASHPARSMDTGVVYVQGDSRCLNNDPIEFDSLKDYLRFVDAVEEYNEYFKEEQIQEMTMEEISKALGKNIKIVKEK